MTIEPSVSVVIPTVGRSTVNAAVMSALTQTLSPRQVIVVLDRPECELTLPASEVVSVIRTRGGEGASRARQIGLDLAGGDVIALLDDDDVWRKDKLERQLAVVPDQPRWVLSCRFTAKPPARAPLVLPRRLIEPHDPVADYLFTFRSLRFGGASLQTSTLVFPRYVAEAVPLSESEGSVHDDPLWLMKVRAAFPDLAIVQLPETLVDYGWSAESLSRTASNRTSEYIAWGKRELAESSTRVRGDYQLTSPVAAAVAAGSLLGIVQSTISGIRCGRPGAWAFAYAGMGFARVLVKRVARLATAVVTRVRR